MKKNYIEHEVKVKFMDSILNNDRDYQWFLEYLENNFDNDDIDSWENFENKYVSFSKIFDYFSKIQKIENEELKTNIVLLKDIILISRFNLDLITWSQVSIKVQSNFGKIIAVALYITKLMSLKNQLNDEINFGIFSIKNFWQAYNLDEVIERKELIYDYLESISIKNFDLVKDIISSNLNHEDMICSMQFLSVLKSLAFNTTTFSYKYYKFEYQVRTWQERIILDFVSRPLDVLLKDEDFNSRFSIEQLQKLIEYFHGNGVVRFIIETIIYERFNLLPSSMVVENHIQLLLYNVSLKSDFELFNSSSVLFLSKLFKERDFKNVSISNYLHRNFIQAIQKIEEPKQIEKLKKLEFPTSVYQNEKLKEYSVSIYKSISNVHSTADLIYYFDNVALVKYLDDEYFYLICKKFREIVIEKKEKQSLETANMFLMYMKFLYFISNNRGEELNKNLLINEIISIQNLWENTYYEQELNNMQEFTYQQEISNTEIDKFNDFLTKHPFAIANQCISVTEQKTIQIMETASENALVYFMNKIIIDPIFPKESSTIELERHDVDQLLEKQVKSIIDNKSYKFLNTLKPSNYILALHENYIQNVTFLATIFNRTEDVYLYLNSCSRFNLIDYNKDIKLAHVTQLFPLLEEKIRELARLSGYNPFKMKKTEFMNYRDPSSILREIITEVFSLTDSFENIPDLLFVYHFMYNSNSLNIRNECIHGRDFLSNGRLILAFKITLFSILMIDSRIKLIKENSK
ncbi:exodeoxyribonuclease V subunit gamma [Streptococcus sanguinis]|jgi:hypothetical protein|uniref:DUF4209 domain-containing protein n=1 Tax=Streptococcus sanguinis SK405 TaxID=888817 RepID=A0ABC9PAY0_STRSA|nr:hypothetical protein [Streptococcus sanguinis]EGC23940.1 hypothetical protein HMPREF9390_1771 [Streptococcus sanguinis SK405]